MRLSPPPVSVSFEEVYAGIQDLLKQSPLLNKLSSEKLYSHIAWYWNRGTMSWVEKPVGGYAGLCLIKLMTDLSDLDQWYTHDPDGRYLFIEEVVSDGPETWQALYDQLHDIWGDREFVLWDRRERTEKKCPRIYTWEMYKKILRRLTRVKEDA